MKRNVVLRRQQCQPLRSPTTDYYIASSTFLFSITQEKCLTTSFKVEFRHHQQSSSSRNLIQVISDDSTTKWLSQIKKLFLTIVCLKWLPTWIGSVPEIYYCLLVANFRHCKFRQLTFGSMPKTKAAVISAGSWANIRTYVLIQQLCINSNPISS